MEIYAEGTKVQGQWMGENYSGVIVYSSAYGLEIKLDAPIHPQASPVKTFISVDAGHIVGQPGVPKYTIEVIEVQAKETKHEQYSKIQTRLYNEVVSAFKAGDKAKGERAVKNYNAANWHYARTMVDGWFTYCWEARRSGREFSYYQ